MNEKFKAWQEEGHVTVFDLWTVRPVWLLKRYIEKHNEIRLLNKLMASLTTKPDILDVGCATGEFLKYIQVKHRNKIDHISGLDISSVALKKARENVKNVNYILGKPDIELRANLTKNYNIVYCRDVILHHPKPFDFLGQLINSTRNDLIVRLRTRDNGKSVLDIEQSCQFHYGKEWVPYFILNINEIIDYLEKSNLVKSVTISRSYNVMGGLAGRYLPKDCYYKSTGTASTALHIVVKDNKESAESMEISYDDKQEEQLNIFERGSQYIFRKAKSVDRVGTHLAQDEN